MKRFSLRYALLTYKLDQLWFPLAFLLLFCLISVIQRNSPQLPTMARSYLGAAMPLVAGILSAYVVLDDPALELRFATPISSIQTLMERLGLIFAVQVLTAFLYQLVYVVIAGTFPCILILAGTTCLFIPAISLMMLGCTFSLLAANSMVGALTTGIVWLVQLIARGWFALNNGKFFLIFMSPFMVDHPLSLPIKLHSLSFPAPFFLALWCC
jgi:hypothetical protein